MHIDARHSLTRSGLYNRKNLDPGRCQPLLNIHDLSKRSSESCASREPGRRDELEKMTSQLILSTKRKQGNVVGVSLVDVGPLCACIFFLFWCLFSVREACPRKDQALTCDPYVVKVGLLLNGWSCHSATTACTWRCYGASPSMPWGMCSRAYLSSPSGWRTADRRTDPRMRTCVRPARRDRHYVLSRRESRTAVRGDDIRTLRAVHWG